MLAGFRFFDPNINTKEPAEDFDGQEDLGVGSLAGKAYVLWMDEASIHIGLPWALI